MKPTIKAIIVSFITIVRLVMSSQPQGYFHHDYSEFRTDQRSTHIILHFHVDDSEVTLNVCLGKQFSGGELYFRGVRCANHMKSPGEEVIYNETYHQSNHCVIYYNSPFSDVVSTIRIFFTMIIVSLKLISGVLT